MIHGTANLRATLPCLTPQDRRADWPALELLHRVVARHHASPGQIALAWLLARSPSISPIPGPITHDQMDQNMETPEVSRAQLTWKESRTASHTSKCRARLREPMLALTDAGGELGMSSAGGHGNSPLP